MYATTQRCNVQVHATFSPYRTFLSLIRNSVITPSLGVVSVLAAITTEIIIK